MTEDLQRIQIDIERARAWARQHFNAYVDEETTPSHLLAKPTCDVTFPEPDTMRVCPVVYGELMLVALAEYRLCWKLTGLCWKGGLCLRPDLVRELRVREVVYD